MAKRIVDTVTIAISTSLSPAFAAGDGALVGIIMPAAWTAAALTFQGSQDGVNFFNIYDAGTERQIATDASRALSLTHTDWLAFPFLKIRSGTSGAAVNQLATRNLTIIRRAFQ